MDIRQSLSPLDLIVIIAYIVILLGLGFSISYRRGQNSDLFLAGRNLTWPNIGLSIFGTNISPSMMLAACSVAYTSGMVAANFEWLAWFFLMLLAMLFIPLYLKTRISTMPEFVERRFGRTSRTFLSWYALFTTVVLWLGGTLYAGGLLLSQISGWPLWVCLVFLASIAASFTITGGLEAVVITDSFQSILMIVASTALTLLAFLKIGSLDRLVQEIPADYWRLFRNADDPTFPWPAIVLGYPVLGVWFWCTDQTIVQRVLGAKDIRHGQMGALFAGFLKILPPLIFFMPGILAAVLYPNLTDPDTAYMTLVTGLLPSGMIGLIVAVLIAALVSTLDSALNSFSTVFTLDIYVTKFRRQASQREIVWVGRLMTAATALLAVAIALSMQSVGRDLFNLMQGIIAFFAPPMAAVFLVGVLWKRATSRAALSTLIIGSTISLAIGYCQLTNYPNNHFWPHYLLLSFYLFSASVIWMIAVSLLDHSRQETEPLPTSREIYSDNISSRNVWIAWGALAVIMAGLYVFFN
ncbi:MAG TPA: sodium:solute symporter [bacterium]|nr:sodium:solute symporter [bacterium]HPG44301.1 sodium:solute symporter [bacterium]HPM96668.1 sodium:solute symporter [bacterium]